MRPRLRELLLIVAVVALALGWAIEARRSAALANELANVAAEVDGWREGEADARRVRAGLEAEAAEWRETAEMGRGGP